MVDVMERPRPSLIIHSIIWPLVILAFTMIMVPLSMMVPVAGVIIGAALGWRARNRQVRYPAVVVAAFAGWLFVASGHLSQYFRSEFDRTGEMVSNEIFLLGAAVLTCVVGALAHRVHRGVAAGVGLAGGLALLQTSTYLLVHLANRQIELSPRLWYIGSMFPYGHWSNTGPLMPPDFGYSESSQWAMMSDTVVIYPGEWTFLLVFLLAYAVTPGVPGSPAHTQE